MPDLKRSTKDLSPAKLKQLKAEAERIDHEEAPDIEARGRVIFAHHDRLRAILRALVAERKQRGLSLADLADRTGIAKPNLSRLENSANTTPGLDTLERYARAVGKTLRIELTDAV